jgi:predicted nucleic acid-binding Zn ribbon protein
LGSRPCPTCGQPIRRGPGQWSYCSDECRPECALEYCERPTQGLSKYCTSHTEVIRRRSGEEPTRHWSTDWVCVVCGADVDKGFGRRKHCSSRCQMLSSLNPNRPKSFDCVKCGNTVSLIVPSTKTGQFKRSDSKLCDRCKRLKKWPITVGELAKRDGADCKICGGLVDFDAGPKNLFRPSVDHVVPRAAGGGDDPSNLQLAHLWCNQVKNKRTDFTLTANQGVAHGN